MTNDFSKRIYSSHYLSFLPLFFFCLWFYIFMFIYLSLVLLWLSTYFSVLSLSQSCIINTVLCTLHISLSLFDIMLSYMSDCMSLSLYSLFISLSFWCFFDSGFFSFSSPFLTNLQHSIWVSKIVGLHSNPYFVVLKKTLKYFTLQFIIHSILHFEMLILFYSKNLKHIKMREIFSNDSTVIYFSSSLYRRILV